MTDSIETRVARGAALLDRTVADWDERIDLDRLDLSSSCNCILGQEFAGAPEVDDGYWTGFDVGLGALPIADHEATDYGFDVNRDDFEEFGLLTAEWKRVIRARRGGAS